MVIVTLEEEKLRLNELLDNTKQAEETVVEMKEV